MCESCADPWIEFLNTVGATFWRGFPYDIAFLVVLLWGFARLDAEKTPNWLRMSIGGVAVFMAVMMAINLAIGTIPAWFNLTTF